MFVLLTITAVLIGVYLLYPIWLLLLTKSENDVEDAYPVDCVSLILLTYNGNKGLQEKIEFLLNELTCFLNSELIIVDDNSIDGTRELLEKYRNVQNVKLILKNSRSGIPDSMNIGVRQACYDIIVFCDQRQKLSKNIIQSLVQPLSNGKTGAISACICAKDRNHKYSFIRHYENFLKAMEGRVGSLVGVYGPLYAVKKKYYPFIPEEIVLDDLYLSLKILKSKQVEIKCDCLILDDEFSTLYDYKRVVRYFRGFMQILSHRELMVDLSLKIRIMLIWHKYLRLIIPFFVGLSYISIGFMIPENRNYAYLFALITIIGIISVLPFQMIPKVRILNLVRLNVLYFVGMIVILCGKHKVKGNTEYSA